MNKSELYPSGAGPWGASPETISSWISKDTRFKDIFDSCINNQEHSIAALNSFCITIGIPYRFNSDTIEEDISCFSIYLQNKRNRNDFSLRVSNIITNKLPEGETENMRDIIERINTGKENIQDSSMSTQGNLGY